MKCFAKRIVAMSLSAMMLLTGSATNIYAETNDNTSSGTTYKGEYVTVSLNNLDANEREQNFNEDWKFYLGSLSTASQQSYDDSSWSTVSLPHDYSITQDFTTSGEAESGFLPGGTGWYRKSFTLDKTFDDKQIVINFDGAYKDTYVYVNGTYVGENHYGYNSFAFDITDYLVKDGVTTNVIAVRTEHELPSSRWYSGSGIYRDVTLITTDKVHVALNGTQVTTPNIASGNGTVNVNVEVDNDSSSAVSATVTNTVYEKGSNTAVASASSTVAVAAGTTETTSSSPVVSSPKLWSTDSPNQYTVVTEVKVNGIVIDTYSTDFGFRWFEYTTSGFKLNGNILKLNGVCLHHDQGALGSAAYYDAMYRQVEKLKDIGVNAIRTSHNPFSEEFIQICSDLGVLVMEEFFDGWTAAKNGNSNDFSQYFSKTISANNVLMNANSSMTWAEFVLKSTVKRDRNEASVFMWDFGNELVTGSSNYDTSNFAEIAQNMVDWTKALDSTRSFTFGDNDSDADTDISKSYNANVMQVLVKNGGVPGYNYSNIDSIRSSVSSYNGYALYTESVSAINSRSRYLSQANGSDVDGAYHLTSYDTSAVSWGTTAHDSLWNTLRYDNIMGQFVWTGFDYIGEPTNWNGTGTGSVSGSGAVPNSSFFGIIDTAGFEKDTYYLYRSQWKQDDTTLHLVTAWDSDNMMTTIGKTPVVIYSNAAKVELYRNGTKIGTATRTVNTTNAGHEYYTYSTTSNNRTYCTAVIGSGSTSLYATFNVTYASGTISAKAYDASGNEITDTHGNSSVSTPGAVTKLNVSSNKTEIAADGSSLAYISVDVTDANGNLNTTASNNIKFSLTGNGEIVGVDNGDQATLNKYQNSSVLTNANNANINAYAGKALVIVRSTKNAGSFTLTASASGLTGGTVTVNTTSSETDRTLRSISMIKSYSIKPGTVPEFDTIVKGTYSDGSTSEGTITWNEVTEAQYNAVGDYTIKGTALINEQEIAVSAELHVLDTVVSMRNISLIGEVNTVPTLPATVVGLKADGSVYGEYAVTWESLDADQFSTLGEIIVVNGTTTLVDGTVMPVTASVRVVEHVVTSQENSAPSAELSQDVPSAYQSDVLTSLNNGTKKPGDNTSERWTNWNNRYNSATAAITMSWKTATLVDSINLYYYQDECSDVAESIKFEYSLDGINFSEISADAECVETYYLGSMYKYSFDHTINPIALRMTFTQKSGTTGANCVGLTEIEVIRDVRSVSAYSSAKLDTINVDQQVIDVTEALSYETTGSKDSNISATSSENVAYTVIPASEGFLIVTLSEDGNASNLYTVNVKQSEHTHSYTREITEEATCTESGVITYTCVDGDDSYTETIPALGHIYDSGVITQDPTCTEAGIRMYTCTTCGNTYTEEVSATGHSYGAPVWNWSEDYQSANAVFTCQNDSSHQETVAAVISRKVEGNVTTYTATISWNNNTYSDSKSVENTEEDDETLIEPSFNNFYATKNTANGAKKIKMTAVFQAAMDDMWEIEEKGFVYIKTSRLGSRNLTVNISGRTKVRINGNSTTTSNGKSYAYYSYSMTPASSSTSYTMCAYVKYKNAEGKSVYKYSKPVVTTFNAFN